MSVKKRAFFSLGANLVRAALSLLTGLVVARALGPDSYGDLAYLLSTFLALRALLDWGSGSAFFTFIAQRERGRAYYLTYYGWLGFQFVFSVALVLVILPPALIERIWLGQGQHLILLALVATFLQNQVWQTIVYIYEAARETIRVQKASLAIVVAHLAIVAALIAFGNLSVSGVLWAIIAEYALAAVVLSTSIGSRQPNNGFARDVGAGLRAEIGPALSAYYRYCRPMIFLALFSFIYEMLDRWLLQRYGGSGQQGFYQVSSQLSTISLLATTSILSILWKEIAEASEQGDRLRVAGLYQKATRILVCFSSIVSCGLIPWADYLVDLLLGKAYQTAWPVLLVMLFYPIHQTVGQINSALFMATGNNNVYMKLTIAGILVSLPVSYILMAPSAGVPIPGFDLGAMGLAIKIVGLNVLLVGIQSWVIARLYQMDFQWGYQLALIPALCIFGVACRIVSENVFSLVVTWDAMNHKGELLAKIMIGSALYLVVSASFLVRFPQLAGMSREELRRYGEKLKKWSRGS